MAISFASALVSSRLDHLNSILHGAASKHINRLQRIPKALARTVMHQRSYGSPLSSTVLLQDLHWLPIEWRIRFKLATLAYKALHTGQPPYLAELLRRNEPVRTLRSSSPVLFSVPRCNLEFDSRAFRISAPNIWNSLPANIRDSPSLPTFRRSQNTLFSVSLPQPLTTTPFSTRPDSLETMAVYKFFTYLLTYLPRVFQSVWVCRLVRKTPVNLHKPASA